MTRLTHLLVGGAALLGSAAPGRADGEFPASWQPVEFAAARSLVEAWLERTAADAQRADATRRLWDAAAESTSSMAPQASELLRRAAEAFALASPRAHALTWACLSGQPLPPAAELAWLNDRSQDPFERHNLRLLLAQRMVQDGLYDEALVQLEGLQPGDVLDPAALLFCRMASHHQLVQPEEARVAAARLLEQEAALPQRYLQLAQLIRQDLRGLEDKSLDHIARRMRDIRRRLDLGRTGPAVQGVERGVVASLDELINQQEDRQKQQQQQQANASGGAPSGRPLEESRPAELKAPGLVDRKDIGATAGWGNLPDKEREQALQQVGRDFPAHYRELIEQYFRELATETAPAAP